MTCSFESISYLKSKLLFELVVERGYGYLMVALKVPAPTAAAGRAVDYILARAVIVVRILVAYLAAEVAQAHESKFAVVMLNVG